MALCLIIVYNIICLLYLNIETCTEYILYFIPEIMLSVNDYVLSFNNTILQVSSSMIRFLEIIIFLILLIRPSSITYVKH